MKWMDGHCDVLWRMWEQKEQLRSFFEEQSYDVTFPRIREAKVKLQWFAIFIPPSVPKGQRFKEALRQIGLFHKHVIQDQHQMVPLTTVKELDLLTDGQCGAILHLEGADALEGDISHLGTLNKLGVRQVGLTWNYANELADGICEKRNRGLTSFGYDVVEEMKQLSMAIDVSHLSVQGFWDIMDIERVAVVASHSNCQAICGHRRNLSDEQIRALIAKKGLIGVNFIPFFLHNTGDQARMDDIFRHLDHLCQLGASDHIYFGSDFDGDEKKLEGLEHMGKLPILHKELIKRFPIEQVNKWIWTNGMQFYQRHL